jgi:hypothetical protein
VCSQTDTVPQSVHKHVKCQQDKLQYNEKALEHMTIVTEEQAKYRLQANAVIHKRYQLYASK